MKRLVFLFLAAVFFAMACKSTRNPAAPQPNEAPIARATANVQSGVAPLLVKFDASSSRDPDGSIAAYSWDFGDGTRTTALAPSHTYVAAGSFVATLTVVDNKNSAGVDTLHIAVR